MHYLRRLQLPAEAATTIAAALLGRTHHQQTVTAGFSNGYSAEIAVVNKTITATLFDKDQEQIAQHESNDRFDKTYTFQDKGDKYEVVIQRTAGVLLTPVIVSAYDRSCGASCPACSSDALHRRPAITSQPGTIRVPVICCRCSAEWVEIFKFAGMSTDLNDWTPPPQH